MRSKKCGKVGIDGIAVYIPKYYVPLVPSDDNDDCLATARGENPAKILYGIGQRNMAIPSEIEDSATMAAEAALNVLERTGTKPEEIGAVICGTETPVDFAKPVAVIVKELLGIDDACFAFDIKHACAGGTLALISAVAHVQAGIVDKKILVISTDIAKYALNSPGEPTQGAGAIAAVISKDPRLLELEGAGKFIGRIAGNIPDFWKPLDREYAEVNGHYSVSANLVTQGLAFGRYKKSVLEEKIIELDDDEIILDKIDYVLFHAPFVGMAKKNFTNMQLKEWLSNKKKLEKILSEPFNVKRVSEEKKSSVLAGRSWLSKYDLAILVENNISIPDVLILDRMMKKEAEKKKLEEAFHVVSEIGNSYNASLWIELTHLLEQEYERIGSKLCGKRINLGSYGSGGNAINMGFVVQKQAGKVLREGKKVSDFLRKRERLTIARYEERRNGLSVPFLENGISYATVQSQKGCETSFSQVLCTSCGGITSNIDGLDVCPKEHDNTKTVDFPLYASVERSFKKGNGCPLTSISQLNLMPVVGGPYQKGTKLRAKFAVLRVDEKDGYTHHGIVYVKE